MRTKRVGDGEEVNKMVREPGGGGWWLGRDLALVHPDVSEVLY